MKRLLFAMAIAGASVGLYGADPGAVSAFSRAEELIGEGELGRAAVIIDSLLHIPGFGTDTMYARVMVEKATMHYSEGDINAMEDATYKALAAIDPGGDPILNASLWNNLAVVQNRRERPDSALTCYRRALDYAVVAGDPSWKAALECNIGTLYYNRGNLASAAEFFTNAVEHASQCDDGYTELASAQLAAMALLQTDRIEEAGESIRHAWELALESGDASLKLRCIPALYGYFDATAQPDSADFYMKAGKELLRSVPSGGTLAGGYRSSKVRWDMSRGRYAEALAELDTLRRMDFAPPGVETYRQAANCLAALGRNREAYLYMDSALTWSDTLAARNLTRAMSEFDVQYGTLRRELENGRLRNSVLQRERLMLALGLLLAVTVITILILVIRHRRLRERMTLERSAEYIRGMEEERRVFSRELHDGVAADLLALRLNISNGRSDSEKIAGMVEQLRLTVRAISHRLMPPEFSNGTLGSVIGAYVRQLGCDNSSGMRVEFVEADVPGDIPEETAREIYRIFQEEISNIIKHGKPSHIDISLQCKAGNMLHLAIDHDGTPPPDAPDGAGIGRRTVDERLKIIGAELQRTSKGVLTSVHLIVPL